MAKVLVVGAGATGSCAAWRLRQALGRDVRIEVWEKARGPGGRMSTNRQELGAVSARADMGAQYLSLDSSDPASSEIAQMLVAKQVCAEVPPAVLSATPERPSGDGWQHLVGRQGGVNDALKQILEDSMADVHYEKRVASLDEQHGQWRARPFEGAPGAFDAVLLAVPGCGPGGDNLNKIRGGYEGWFSREQNNSLLNTQHDARWAVALYLTMECKAKCDLFFGPTDMERVVDSGPVHLLCYQSRKTEQASGLPCDGGISVVAHTTHDFAKRNARASGRDQRLLWEVAEHVAGTLGLDISLSKAMLASKVITWKQCQVTRPVAAVGADGPCMVVARSPILVLAGDYFTESNFSGCIRSACAAADAVADALKGCKTSTLRTEDGADNNRRGGKGGEGSGGKGSHSGKGSKGKIDTKGEASKGGYPEIQKGGDHKGKSKKGKGREKGGKSGNAWKVVQ